ncbi:hypothetical protein [Nonomuraea sp. NPDC023979]|uniref:hypothetical protein n=1 Tax=Nonomuraea sp. NPDC023979 TaxID=3154796 RepID=UPI0033F0F2DC
MTRRILLALAWIVLDLIEAAAYFLAVALLTALIGLVLPLAAAFAVALLGVSVCFGYRQALRIERARERGEHR